MGRRYLSDTALPKSTTGLISGKPLPLAMRVSRASMEHMNLLGFMFSARKASR
jgi:hypothetical protein